MEQLKTPSDETRGTRSANAVLRDLYELEYGGMVRLAYTLVRSNAEAEDIVQDAFVEVHQKLSTIRNPGGYLRSAVVNRCRSAIRRRRMIAQHPAEPLGHQFPEAGHLWDVLAALPDDQQIAIVLRYYCGYRSAEIAAITNTPGATIRSHIRRGLAVLRKELEV